MIPRLTVLISGEGTNLQAVLDGLHPGVVQVVHVLADRPAPGLLRAAQRQIPTTVVPWSSSREQASRTFADEVAATAPDLVVLAGFLRVLHPVFLDRFPGRVLNLHPALPGRFPGLHAVERAWQAHLDHGLTHTGVMVHEAVEEVDAGPVWGQVEVAIPESLDALEAAMRSAEHTLLVSTIRAFAQSCSGSAGSVSSPLQKSGSPRGPS